jgi:D-alanyl-lipoteichoic acid acyltransferase DltB (MBOAT superfamily)
MLFNSYAFVVFFCSVVILYYTLPAWRQRKALLLTASYVFYAAWNPPFVMLLWISTIVDWFAAKGIHTCQFRHRRRLYLAVSLLANLGLLGYFKYGTFLLENFLALAQSLGWNLTLAKPSIILPVGISFYTFQTLSYTLDVYRRRMAPADSFLDYALYVTFFPQLVAGPIVRAGDFLPQCHQPKSFSGRAVGWGLSLMLLGLFEKIAIADGLLAPIAEAVYDSPRQPDFLSAWCGTFAFAGQIFLDFGGYSLCAIGAAMCLGFSIQDNFRSPYAAVGFSDFWRRWHISLSSWLRDYLYIPLGGNRRGHFRTLAALSITMLLGGLWHGASWTFVVWGGLHGGYLMLERGVRRIVPRPLAASPLLQLPAGLLTFLLLCMAWVFFRADSLDRASNMAATLLGLGPAGVKGILQPPPDGATRLLQPESIALALGITAVLLSIHWLTRNRSLADVATRLPWWARSLVLAAMIVGILGLSGEDHAFIYFQF